MRKHGGTPSRRDKHVTLAAISPPGVARGRFVGGQQSGLAGSKPPPLFTRKASSCSSQGRRQGEPWGASPRPSAPTYLPTVKTCSTWAEVLQRLEKTFPVYETDRSVRTQIEELLMLPEFPSAVRISEYVCDLEYLFSRMNVGSYGATEPHLWLMSKIPQRKEGPYQDRPLLCPFRMSPLLTCS